MLWPAVGCQERLCGTGILLPQDFCSKKIQAFYGAANQKKNFFFEFSSLSLGNKPLAKEPEDSEYEIDYTHIL